MSAHGILNLLMGAAQNYRSMLRLSRDSKVSREAMYHALKTRSDPRLSTVVKLADTLGYELVLSKRSKQNAVQGI